MDTFLLDLACEYYQFMEFFIKRRVAFVESETGVNRQLMDVLAYNYKEKILFHIQQNRESDTLEKSKTKMIKIFNEAELYYSDHVDTMNLQIQKVSIVGAENENVEEIKNSEKETRSKVFNIKEFMKHINVEVKKFDPIRELIPENYPLLRAFQLTLAF